MMRADFRLFLPAAVIASAVATMACSGGGGSYDANLLSKGREKASLSGEGAASSREETALSSESAPGSKPGDEGEAESFACSGTYRCAVSGQSAPRTVVLSTDDGDCEVKGKDIDYVVLADGTVAEDGEIVGTWVATKAGFNATSPEGVATCVRQTGDEDDSSGVDEGSSSDETSSSNDEG